MSPLSRFGPLAMKSIYFHQQRGLAAAVTKADPIQRLFVDKIKEFKNTNKGLDEEYKKRETEELARLKKVYQVENEAKVGQVEASFDKVAPVSLGDLDENREKFKAILSGEYEKKKQLELDSMAIGSKKVAAKEVHHSPYHLPPLDREPYPDLTPLYLKAPASPELGEPKLAYEAGLKGLDPDEFEKSLDVKFGPKMPTIDDDNSPSRDVVNFPRLNQLDELPPRYLHVLPRSWFDFFHSKTGVTGGWTLAATFSTFLLSKEWLVLEHELYAGFSLTIIFTVLVYKAGPLLSKYIHAGLEQFIKDWNNWQQDHIKFLDQTIKHYKEQAKIVDKVPVFYDARREDIQVQLEAEYRRRLKAVHDSTTRKLNYLVAVADSKRNIAHKHMVNWVIDNAIRSIGPKQEADVLDNCISSLKDLAVKNANAI